VSLAAIGYHFRSTQALMNAALVEALEEWGAELGRALKPGNAPPATPLERFELYWTRVIESISQRRPLWVATFEVVAQLDHVPELRQVLAEGLEGGRALWASFLQYLDMATKEKQARAVGSFYQALLSGVLAQWLIDPEHAPTARDLTEALRMISAKVASGP
jgi:AcrR family transcriptional regulator